LPTAFERTEEAAAAAGITAAATTAAGNQVAAAVAAGATSVVEATELAATGVSTAVADGSAAVTTAVAGVGTGIAALEASTLGVEAAILAQDHSVTVQPADVVVNFPDTMEVTGTVNVGNTVNVSGTVSVGNTMSLANEIAQAIAEQTIDVALQTPNYIAGLIADAIESRQLSVTSSDKDLIGIIDGINTSAPEPGFAVTVRTFNGDVLFLQKVTTPTISTITASNWDTFKYQYRIVYRKAGQEIWRIANNAVDIGQDLSVEIPADQITVQATLPDTMNVNVVNTVGVTGTVNANVTNTVDVSGDVVVSGTVDQDTAVGTIHLINNSGTHITLDNGEIRTVTIDYGYSVGDRVTYRENGLPKLVRFNLDRST